MINYHRSAFGLNLLLRIHGSAVYRAFFPALISVLMFLFLRMYINEDDAQPVEQTLEHPYVIGVVVSGITFLIVFRASSSYARYWEATSSLYQMQSKWMDATIQTACYHMQCKHYDHIKPPTFFDYPQLNAQFLTRDRERVTLSMSDQGHQGVMNSKRATERSINAIVSESPKSSWSGNSSRSRSRGESYRKPKLQQQASDRFETASSVQERRSRTGRTSYAVNRGGATALHNGLNHVSTASDESAVPHFLAGRERLDGNWGELFPDGKATFVDPKQHHVRHPMGFASFQGGRTPPIFLQELAHLASLLTAVALSTLRNDVDGSESPLDFYQIGTPWPEVDPKEIPELNVSGFAQFTVNLQYFLGVARTPEERTKYNAARPLGVLGGVSDNEITFLQMARGPYAKTQLCWMWISEFITREHLAGTLGDVGPPIISRIIQFLGDGMVHYNHARKIMFIPFPFPHAQLSAVYVLVMIPMIPYMMDQYCSTTWIGCTLTFLSVACLSGIHEVARELENPFRNVPNELPVCTLMAEFNEALVTMYAGYHPDFFWEVPEDLDFDFKENNSDDHPDGSFLYSEVGAGAGAGIRRSGQSETLTEGSCEDSSSQREGGEDDDIPKDETPKLLSDTIKMDKATNGNDEKVVPTPPNGNSSKTMISSSSGDDAAKTTLTPPATTSTVNGTKPRNSNSLEVDQLRAIVLQQGKMMGKMLEEQARLNKMIEAVLQNEDADSGNTEDTATA
jgi:predicted membrane chloride channel (bestrophin family)